MTKTALITGANRGIGLEIVRQLGQIGFHVFLAARNSAKGEAASKALQNKSLNVEFIPLDVGDMESIQRAVQLVKSKTPQLDILINNAGVLLD